VVVNSLKSSQDIFRSPWGLPSSLQWSNFSNAWRDAGIAHYFLNSLIATVGTLVILIPIGSMAAYVLARYPFPGSKFLSGTFLGGMMFPQFLVIVPLFHLMSQIQKVSPGVGLNTMPGLIVVYVAYSLSFTVFVMTGFFQTLPKELDEAATIDGCSHSQTFWKVMFPLAKPGLIVVAIFNAIGLWNEYPLALVLANTDEIRTLPLGIAKLAMNKQYAGDLGALFAGLVIVMIPVLLVYWIFREKIHETMLAGAIKG